VKKLLLFLSIFSFNYGITIIHETTAGGRLGEAVGRGIGSVLERIEEHKIDKILIDMD
jgi:hypothetical protein